MTYTILYTNEKFSAGRAIDIPATLLEKAARDSGYHVGTMTDIIASETGMTRGDSSRVVGEFFESIQ